MLASGPESFFPPKCDSFANSSDTVPLPHSNLNSLYQELSGIPPSFRRLIIMVIDGLPAEFVLGKDGHFPSNTIREAMPYTQSLLANGMAIGYHAKAAPPTVTMPRLKAMVSGAIGGFLDVAFNFNTQAMLDDNLLGQFLKIGWKMVMLGDETWLKLFPGSFTRHDGVSSFFVKDTVQVDHNVSRHLAEELSREDWNLVILHYLGLDHVGHTGGRNSVLMAPKLTEMDEVIHKIHSNIQAQNNDGRETLLMVVSDHGMTENGNHGGSSYEETDSLALFIGLKNHVSDYVFATDNSAFQVDIASTLAILFGVPIPKNNVGILLSKVFDSLKEDHWLKALELNSWQLLRLVKAQLPGLSCDKYLCDGFDYNKKFCARDSDGSVEKLFCCLYTTAEVLHTSWKTKGMTSKDAYKDTVAAYDVFLKTASEWLSRRVTDKPVDFLAYGVLAMLLSCLILLTLIICLYQEDFHLRKKQQPSETSNKFHTWCSDEIFVLAVVLIFVISMASSSMVEEEHYIWHFMASTLYLLFLRQAAPKMNYSQICSICVALICGRILRGWHQGGVNWTHLPDIAKWLDQDGSEFVQPIRLVSGIMVITLALSILFLKNRKRKSSLFIGFSFFIAGLLVLQHMRYQENTFISSTYSATSLAQIIYSVIAITTIGSAVILPWVTPFCISKPPLNGLRDLLYVIGWVYISCWCLLQLLLQQPTNSVPICLLLVQVMAIMLYFSPTAPYSKGWVEVAAFCYLGLAGHYALGNSNSLATIDVAGAFIGISSHSTLLSGILMFMITYASPMLALLSMVMYISTKDFAIPSNADVGYVLKTLLGFPCLIPLGFNSINLTAYTIVLLLMRNHLFVWSVFSPKYLYVCASTVCIYIGVFIVAATVTYTVAALNHRSKFQVSKTDEIR
ncbi:hypothetical protein ACFE04_021317 [Oxalis oulophora]